jgi:long-chain fatty acid transport protein
MRTAGLFATRSSSPRLSIGGTGPTAVFVTTTIVSAWYNPAWASGFALREFSLSAASTSFAGASANNDSPAFLGFNPALASGVQDQDFQITLNAIAPSSEANFVIANTSAGAQVSGSRNPEGFIQEAIEPGLSLRKRLADSWTAGLSITAPWGLSTRYDAGWAGRYYAVESKLLTVNLAPDIAWRMNDQFAFGAGLQFQYAEGKLSNAIDFGSLGSLLSVPGAMPGQQDGFVAFTAKDWGIGYRLGMLWQPSPDIAVGLAWRSGIKHTLRGNVDFLMDSAGVGTAISAASGAFIDGSARTTLSLPSTTSAGISWKTNERLTIMGEVAFTDWSTIKELRVNFDNPVQPDDFQTYNWSDTWLLAFGARYDVDERWTLRAGAAVDGSPTRDSTRDPRIPDATRTWLSASIEHHLSPTLSMQLGYAKLLFPEEPINLIPSAPGNQLRGSLAGTTDSDADMISFQITVR